MALRLEKTTTPTNKLKRLLTADQESILKKWLREEFQNADAAAFSQRTTWKEALRRYAGVPSKKSRDFPIVDAPNIEVALAAIASDAIYAQGHDLIFAVSPLLTVQATKRGGETMVNAAKDLQDLVDWLVPAVELPTAFEHAWLDDVQLGTGLFYIPWIEESRKTRLGTAGRRKMLSKRPIVYPVPPEDFKVPGGKGIRNTQIQSAPWIAHRFYYSQHELDELKVLKDWTLKPKLTPASQDDVTFRRNYYGKTSQTKKSEKEMLYESWATYCLYDLDEDGQREELLVHYNYNDDHLFLCEWQPYDYRPYEKMVYQMKPHLFYGMGVPEMLGIFQEEISDIHNERNTNMKLANTRCFKGLPDVIEGSTVRLWPGRFFPTQDPQNFDAIQIADVYPSSAQAEALTMALAERRVGINDMSMQPSQIASSRTPATTATSLLNQVNRRFTPAFDSMRQGTAAAMKQCLYRIQERLLAGDKDVETWLIQILGAEKAGRVIALLRKDTFDDAVEVVLTASTASANRDAERQNAIVLVNLLGNYYQKALELAMIAANPQTPPAVVEVATKIASAASEMIQRTIRTFDSISDPDRFIVDMGETLDKLQVNQQGLAGLAQMMASMQQPPTPVSQGL